MVSNSCYFTKATFLCQCCKKKELARSSAIWNTKSIDVISLQKRQSWSQPWRHHIFPDIGFYSDILQRPWLADLSTMFLILYTYLAYINLPYPGLRPYSFYPICHYTHFFSLFSNFLFCSSASYPLHIWSTTSFKFMTFGGLPLLSTGHLF